MEFVEKIYSDNREILEYLNTQNEISFRVDLDSKLKKIILMSSASYFEKLVTDMLEEYAIKATNSNVMLVAFIKNKAISRNYHTLFDWKASNINGFLGLFGDTFKEDVKADIESDDSLKSAIKSFLLIGSERNKLVHINFASFLIDLTSDEIFEHHQNALKLVDYLRTKLDL